MEVVGQQVAHGDRLGLEVLEADAPIVAGVGTGPPRPTVTPPVITYGTVDVGRDLLHQLGRPPTRQVQEPGLGQEPPHRLIVVVRGERPTQVQW